MPNQIDSKVKVINTFSNLDGGTQLEVGGNLAAGTYVVNITNNGVSKIYKLIRLP
jgi:hypothetical protein